MSKFFVFGVLFLFIGATCLIISNNMLPFHSPEQYQQELSEVPYGDSARFYEVKKSFRTEKDAVFDMGILDLILGSILCLFGIFKWRRIFAAPRYIIVLFAITAPLLSGYGQFIALEMSFSRSEFPSWADTMAIPLMGIIIFCGVSLLFALYHLGLLRDCHDEPIVLGAISEEWLRVLVVLNLIFLCDSAFYGAWWEVIPSIAWIYFFASIGTRLPDET